MNEFAKMDVFFLVTTIAVALVGILLVVVLVYVIKIMNDVKHISNKAKEESDKLADDIDALRMKARDEGIKLTTAAGFFTGIMKRYKHKK